jgi:hypothetical protein
MIPCGGGLEHLHLSPVSSKRRRKGNPVPLSLGDINTETWFSMLGVGLKADDIDLMCKTKKGNIVKSK